MLGIAASVGKSREGARIVGLCASAVILGAIAFEAYSGLLAVHLPVLGGVSLVVFWTLYFSPGFDP